MKNSVADSCDLICILDDAVLFVLKGIHNHLNSYGMIRHRILNYILVLVCRLMSQLGALNSDSLAKSLCDNTLILHIDQLILK